MQYKLLLFSIIFISAIKVYSQQISIGGKVIDIQTLQTLSFANIRVPNTTMGTSSNINGKYELKLNAGKYVLIASYIGYYSDTLEVNLDQNLYDVNFSLLQTKVDLPEIVIKPGENPAVEIIRKAIEKKKHRNQQIKNYEVEAYTKGIIRTTEDIAANNNSIGVGLGEMIQQS